MAYQINARDSKKLDQWFTYHSPNPCQQKRLEAVRDAAKAFAVCLMASAPSGNSAIVFFEEGNRHAT